MWCVGGTRRCVQCDGNDGWQSPVPRGDNTGGRVQVPHLPTIVCLPGRLVPNLVMGSFSRVCSGTSVHSTRGVAASFLTRCRGSRLLRPRRCGDFGLVSRHEPAEQRFLMFPLFPTLRRRAPNAEERLRNQRHSHAGELRYQRLSDN